MAAQEGRGYTVYRPPDLTVFSRRRARVWFLLHRRRFHDGLPVVASAPVSTGVYPLRRTAGELVYARARGRDLWPAAGLVFARQVASVCTLHTGSLPQNHRKRNKDDFW